ncbi:hypothetical protein JADG_004501 [Aureobasidium aubasidani]|nr:hypothetical protein JADG_004501 [Aureobasidium pullulans]
MASIFRPAAASMRACIEQVPASRTMLRQPNPRLCRQFHATRTAAMASRRGPVGPPKTKDRGPESKEDTQTDFAAMNVLGNTPAPTTAIDACAHDDEGVGQNLHPTFHAVIDTPTPPNLEQDREDVDSPLRNPRAAPQPPRLPAVIISPATPSSQFRKTPTPRSPSPPSRRPSLVEKARRYSENLILPFLPSSSSRRNSVSSQRPKSSEDRDTTLHPFWRPRGFWDDFTDSEEEYSDDELPAGGDTSDIRSLESVEEQQQKGMQGWRAKRLSVRLPGFRGNGGFMLGNSLGIDRHGTNEHGWAKARAFDKVIHLPFPPKTEIHRSSSRGCSID